MTTKDIEVSHKIIEEHELINELTNAGPLSNEERELLIKMGAIDPGDQVALLQIQGLKGLLEIKN